MGKTLSQPHLPGIPLRRYAFRLICGLVAIEGSVDATDRTDAAQRLMSHPRLSGLGRPQIEEVSHDA